MHSNASGWDTSFVLKQLKDSFSKLKISDNSIDKAAIEAQITEYFMEKFQSLITYDWKYDFIDLFCGAGGLSVGFEQEGFRPVVAVDNNEAAVRTYRFNRPWLTADNVINEDIRHIVGKSVFPHVPLVVGGPPCQGFSIVNMHKKENDERNELYKFYVHTVDQVKPVVFLMENVEGILQIIENIREDFAEIGYVVCNPLLLNTKEFGFPQSRRRAFIMGISAEYASIKDDLFGIFTRTIDSFRSSQPFTLWDAISDLPALSAKTLKNSTNVENMVWGYTYGPFRQVNTQYARLVNRGLPSELPLLNHRSKYNNDRDIQIYQTLKPGEKSDAESIQDINPYKNRSDIFRDKFDKLSADEPCKTITAHMYYDCNMYIHPTQARGLTPREAARVQGFPDDYLFLGSPNEWYRQIGNAVSPLMARVLAKALKNVLERIFAK